MDFQGNTLRRELPERRDLPNASCSLHSGNLADFVLQACSYDVYTPRALNGLVLGIVKSNCIRFQERKRDDDEIIGASYLDARTSSDIAYGVSSEYGASNQDQAE